MFTLHCPITLFDIITILFYFWVYVQTTELDKQLFMCEFINIPSLVTNTVMNILRLSFVFLLMKHVFLTLIIAGF